MRPMRRHVQQLAIEEAEAILAQGTSGVLAVLGDEGYPYAVPLSYAYADGRLLFHSALAGHKLDAIREHPKASFCVIDQDEVKPEELSTDYRSVIAFGRIRIVEDEAERIAALAALADRYAPGLSEARDREIASQLSRTAVIELTVEHLSGKEAIEIVRRRKAQASG